ncbi:hypothetical protein G9A89_000331 [Geosiphon pyriformis]|nr:hypothetical protein G9A89_000331 [Geosiphon pyriformis]
MTVRGSSHPTVISTMITPPPPTTNHTKYQSDGSNDPSPLYIYKSQQGYSTAAIYRPCNIHDPLGTITEDTGTYD